MLERLINCRPSGSFLRWRGLEGVSEKPMIKAIKGVKDILPADVSVWQKIESEARDVFRRYGYQEVRIPIFEQTELFARSIGAETDVVKRAEMGISRWESV